MAGGGSLMRGGGGGGPLSEEGRGGLSPEGGAGDLLSGGEGNGMLLLSVAAAIPGFSPCIVGGVVSCIFTGSTFVTDSAEVMVASGEAPASNEPL